MIACTKTAKYKNNTSLGHGLVKSDGCCSDHFKDSSPFKIIRTSNCFKEMITFVLDSTHKNDIM